MGRLNCISPIVLAVVVTAAAPAIAQDRAQEVLAQARAAMNSKGALASVASLSVSANVRRVIPTMGMELSSEVQLEFLLPDKYRRTENISIGAVSRTVAVALNGDALLYDDGGAAAMTGIDPTAPGPARDQIVKGLKEDAFRMLTMLLLAPPANMETTVTSAGVAEAPDGKADAVDVKGPGTLNLRLYLDTISHRLLLATYQVESLDADQLKALSQKTMERAKADPGNMQKLTQEMRDEADKLPKKMITIQMRFAEPKAMGNITMPTKITVEGAPQGQEEWTITSFKVNPPLKSERFSK